MTKVPMISLGEALPKEAQRKLDEFVNAFKRGKLLREPNKSVRQLLKERVLEPYRKQLEDKWDLDYLSYAICYALQQTYGINLLE